MSPLFIFTRHKGNISGKIGLMPQLLARKVLKNYNNVPQKNVDRKSFFLCVITMMMTIITMITPFFSSSSFAHSFLYIIILTHDSFSDEFRSFFTTFFMPLFQSIHRMHGKGTVVISRFIGGILLLFLRFF